MSPGGLAEIIAPRIVLEQRCSAKPAHFEEQILIHAMNDVLTRPPLHKPGVPRACVP